MKKLIPFLLFANCAFAQIKNGEPAPNIQFKTLLNAPVKHANLEDLKGKLVVLEFWATWCSPCVDAMPHLFDLQKQFPDKVQVITLTDESVKRTTQFLSARPNNLWFGVDSAGIIAASFPHRLIPHTVLIGPDGKLLASTLPEYVTANVIDSILNNKTVHLPPKTDNLQSVDDILNTYFHADDTVKNRFIIQPEIKGAPGFARNYLKNEAFNGRRLTAINLTVLPLYEIAYGGFPFSRIVDRLPPGDIKPSYCLDIVVPQKADLLPTLQKELAKHFEVKAKIEQHPKEVYVLKITDQQKFKTLTKNTSGTPTYSAQKGEIDQQDMTMADLADYLENFCINTAVVDETGNTEKFDIKFEYQPEKSHSLSDALATMGLSITKEKRKIDMLILCKDGQ